MTEKKLDLDVLMDGDIDAEPFVIERKCTICDKEIQYSDYYHHNYTKNGKPGRYWDKIWNNNQIALLCCKCKDIFVTFQMDDHTIIPLSKYVYRIYLFDPIKRQGPYYTIELSKIQYENLKKWGIIE